MSNEVAAIVGKDTSLPLFLIYASAHLMFSPAATYENYF